MVYKCKAKAEKSIEYYKEFSGVYHWGKVKPFQDVANYCLCAAVLAFFSGFFTVAGMLVIPYVAICVYLVYYKIKCLIQKEHFVPNGSYDYNPAPGSDFDLYFSYELGEDCISIFSPRESVFNRKAVFYYSMCSRIYVAKSQVYFEFKNKVHPIVCSEYLGNSDMYLELNDRVNNAIKIDTDYTLKS